MTYGDLKADTDVFTKYLMRQESLSMSETIIQPIDENGVLGPKILVKKSYLKKLWEFWFGVTRNVFALVGFFWVISWFV